MFVHTVLLYHTFLILQAFFEKKSEKIEKIFSFFEKELKKEENYGKNS